MLRPVAMVTTAKSSPPNSRLSASSDGSSLRQGAHQVAQKLTARYLPRNSDSRCSPPPASVKPVSGTGAGSAWMTSFIIDPSRSASSAACPGAAAFAPKARAV